MTRLSELGEFGLISRLTAGIKYGAGVIKGVGDDAAVLDYGDRWILFTTDAAVEDVHFRLGQVAPEDVGYKALAVNISDIAAMGGRPLYAVVAAGLPDYFSLEEAAALYEGLREAAQKYGVSLVGGDTTTAPVLFISIALLGESAPGCARYRSGAKAGDIICTTGSLGGGAAGLFLLANEGVPCPEPLRSFLLRKYKRPEPRVEAGLTLSSIPAVHALIDVSDGLASELHHIADESGCGCRLFRAAVPVEPAAELVGRRAGIDPVEWALFGGDDYELVFTVAPEAMGEVNEALSSVGSSCRPVGIVVREKGVWLVHQDGSTSDLPPAGYEHFVTGRSPVNR
ncbi:MAG: thiamine-phosphate kinase [Bacillota bacterium]